jgi:hypothetical protein
MDVRFKFHGESVTMHELFEDLYGRIDELTEDIDDALDQTNARIDQLEEDLGLVESATSSEAEDETTPRTNPPKP